VRIILKSDVGNLFLGEFKEKKREISTVEKSFPIILTLTHEGLTINSVKGII